MDSIVHIGEAARRLNCTPEHLRNLERSGRIPKAQRDYNGRVYSQFDLALLKALGVGSRPRRLKSPVEMLRANA
jgi:DNA-binding transcriptional MerR regulator